MDRALSFLRVFDISFFAPGVVFYWILQKFTCFFSVNLLEMGLDLKNAEGLISLVVTIGIIYICGLLIHGFREFLFYIKDLVFGNNEWLKFLDLQKIKPCKFNNSSWYTKLGKNSREDLASYFWYMRAVCWNLCLTFIIIIPIVWSVHNLVSLWLLVPFLLLILLGKMFDIGLRRAGNAAA